MVGPFCIGRMGIGAGNAIQALSSSGQTRLMRAKSIKTELNLLYLLTPMKTIFCSDFDWEMNSSFGLVVISLMLKGLPKIFTFHFERLKHLLFLTKTVKERLSYTTRMDNMYSGLTGPHPKVTCQKLTWHVPIEWMIRNGMTTTSQMVEGTGSM